MTDEEYGRIDGRLTAGESYRDIVATIPELQAYPSPMEVLKQRMKRYRRAKRKQGLDPVAPVEVSDQDQMRQDQRFSVLQSQLNKTTRLYNQALQSLELQEQILALGRDTLKTLPAVKQPCITPKIRQGGKTQEDAVLNIGDIHYGEVVSYHEMRGLNEYNTDVANQRLKALVETVTDLTLNKLTGYQLTKLHVNLLGDMVTGVIHDELRETNDQDIVTLSIELAYILAQMMQELLLSFPRIEIEGVIGNHGRVTKKPPFKQRFVNWDYVCYQFLSMFLAEEIRTKRVVCRFPVSFWTIKQIHESNWLLMHGDNIRSWMSIPWYGITRAVHKLKELIATQKEFFDYIVLGHFHNLGALDMMQGEMIINGSLVGGNEYSVGKMYTTSRPVQLFCGVHRKHGITWRYPIDVQDRPVMGSLYRTADLPTRAAGEMMVV